MIRGSTGTENVFEHDFKYQNENDSVGLYLNEIRNIELLSREEEIELAKRIEKGRLASTVFTRVKSGTRKSKEIISQIRDGQSAFDHLVSSNMRLVIFVAKKYQGNGLSFLDLIQEGNLGLIRAVKKFDYRLGNKFSTHATWWIKQAVTRAIAEKGRTIRLSFHLDYQISKLRREQKRLFQQLARTPDIDELAESTGFPPDKVEYILKALSLPISLDKPFHHGEETDLGDIIEDDRLQAPEDVIAADLLRDMIKKFMNSLSAREARVIQLRFGFLDGRVYTLSETGSKMELSRERVRQIEKEAIKKMKGSTIQCKLYEYLQL